MTAAEEEALTTADQAALDNVISWFPRAKVGPLEPHTPETRRHYDELLATQTAAIPPRGLLVEADEVLAEDAVPPGMSGRLFDGIAFAEEASNAGPSIWGDGEQILWQTGEPLMLYGPQGVGKSTIAQRILLARAGAIPTLLGIHIEPADAPILYVAADRPLQLSRSWRRMVDGLDREQREIVRDLVRFWKGPLGFDIGAEPERLLHLMVDIGARTLIADSLKDLAVDLVKDEAGTRVNRAWQLLIAAGVEVCDLHHPRKAVAGDAGKPKSLDDVYGSTWLSAGHGSVVLLWGKPGDPIIELGHLKQPQEEVGPLRVVIDHDTGDVNVFEGGDALAIVRSSGSPMSAKDVARVLFSASNPTDAETEKARRRLEKLATRGLVYADRRGRDDHGRPLPVVYVATTEDR